MKYTTVFLDLDDTLIDTQESSRITLEEVYHEYGVDKYYSTYEEFSNIYLRNNHLLWEKYSRGEIQKSAILEGRFTFPFSQFEDIEDGYIQTMNDDYLERITSKNMQIGGAKDLLEYLNQKYQIVILSNGFTELQYKKIESTGLGKYFDKVILSDTVGINKPHPDIFNYALSETERNASEVIMIGDNLFTDISGAYNSNIDQIWFNPKDESPKDIKPTYIVNTLAEIKDIL